MTGQEFRAIRIFNKITQEEMAVKLGFSTRDTIRKYENTDFLPQKFVISLSELLKIDFTKESVLADYMKKLPKDIHHKYKVTNDIFSSKNANSFF